jgi:cysteine desulfurase
VRPIYMDHSATTQVDPEVFNAMIPYLIDRLANSSSVHSYGRMHAGRLKKPENRWQN